MIRQVDARGRVLDRWLGRHDGVAYLGMCRQEKREPRCGIVVLDVVSTQPRLQRSKEAGVFPKEASDVSRTLEVKWNAKRAGDQETSRLPRGMIDCRHLRADRWKIRIINA